MKLFVISIALALTLAACGGGAADTSQAAPVKAVAAPAGQDWTQTVARTAEGYVMGNPAAAIKLVEYGSRLCPTCRAVATEGFEPLTANYVKSGKVSFEFREFLVHGQVDVPPSLLGSCVGADPFFPLLEQMYQNQPQFLDALQKSDPAVEARINAAKPPQTFLLMGRAMGLIEFVKARGVPEAKATQCLTDMAEINRLTKQTQGKGPESAGGDGTVSGTPTFLINGKVADGVITWTALDQALKRAGA